MTLVPLGPGEGIEAILARGLQLSSSREAALLWWFRRACDVAMQSCCLKSRCGAVLVGRNPFVQPGTETLFGGSLVAQGFNGPPQNDPAYRRCGATTPSLKHPKAGRTCCVHAEVRALLGAPRQVAGTTLYFARVGAAGELLPSGRPWCTECSKLALDLGVKTWVLWHADGPAEYDADHYDWLSNQYDAYEASGELDAAPEADASASPVPRDLTEAERAVLEEIRQIPDVEIRAGLKSMSPATRWASVYRAIGVMKGLPADAVKDTDALYDEELSPSPKGGGPSL